jgi:cytochrome P450 / NADPH-cytochrome P450 reductase
MEATTDRHVRDKLEKLSGDDYYEQVTMKRVSVLDLLEEFPSIVLPIASFLAMLPPMRVRQ